MQFVYSMAHELANINPYYVLILAMCTNSHYLITFLVAEQRNVTKDIAEKWTYDY